MVDIFVFVVLIVGFSLVARRLERAWITAPIVFTVAGWVMAELGDRLLGLPTSVIHHLAEATLVILLFHDASTVPLRELRSEWHLVVRLLLIGLPLTVLAGYGLSKVLMPELGPGLPLLLAAALAPTDAGLGAPTVLNPIVPRRVRSLLNVESGLNDGLATPVVLVALALAVGHGADTGFVRITVEIAVGVAVGVAAGAIGGRALTAANRRGWVTPLGRAVAMLALPFVAYSGAALLDGNGFVAAFVAGLFFGAVAHRLAHVEENEIVIESATEVLGAAVWFLFGAVIGNAVTGVVTWETVVFAVASLTVLRMVPVALSLIGSGLRGPTAWFIGWFGPRGLASLVFALLSVEELGGEAARFDDGHERVLATIGLTVLLSVFAHGLTSGPLAERYGRWFSERRPPVEAGET